MHKPLVSVIMPVYNSERYLKEAIESVLQQTYYNWELIIINDASTDDSSEIIKIYCNFDERIKVIDLQERLSIGLVRNVGLKEVKGDFIAWLDSDDVYHFQFLEIMVKTSLNEDSDIVECKVLNFSDTIPFKDKTNLKIKEKEIDKITGEEFMKGWFEKKYQTSLCSKLFKKDLFINFNFLDTVIFEEGSFYYNNYKKFISISIISQFLYAYRNHSDSSIRRLTNKFIEDSIKVSEHSLNFFNQFPTYKNSILLQQLNNFFLIWKKSIYKGIDKNHIYLIEKEIKKRLYLTKEKNKTIIKDLILFKLRFFPGYYSIRYQWAKFKKYIN